MAVFQLSVQHVFLRKAWAGACCAVSILLSVIPSRSRISAISVFVDHLSIQDGGKPECSRMPDSNTNELSTRFLPMSFSTEDTSSWLMRPSTLAIRQASCLRELRCRFRNIGYSECFSCVTSAFRHPRRKGAKKVTRCAKHSPLPTKRKYMRFFVLTQEKVST